MFTIKKNNSQRRSFRPFRPFTNFEKQYLKRLGTSLNGPVRESKKQSASQQDASQQQVQQDASQQQVQQDASQQRTNNQGASQKQTNKKRSIKPKQSMRKLATIKEVNKNKMATEIQRMFRGRVNAKLRPQFLSRVCPDSSECLIIGKQRDIAHKFFEGFKNLKYLDEYKKINSGANGSIFRINFLKNGYNSYGALKIATPFDSHLTSATLIERKFQENIPIDNLYLTEPDNMIYEYLVGLYLNQYIDYFPNFLETYQLFKITDFNTYKNIILQIHDTNPVNNVDPSVLKTDMEPLNYENILKNLDHLKDAINDGCTANSFGIDKLRNSYTYCLMTQKTNHT
jgi:hypothetical protein